MTFSPHTKHWFKLKAFRIKYICVHMFKITALISIDRDGSPFEPHRDKTNKMACAPSEDSDQPGHPPSLIRVFAVHSIGS